MTVLALTSAGAAIYATFTVAFTAWVDHWMRQDHTRRYARATNQTQEEP